MVNWRLESLDALHCWCKLCNCRPSFFKWNCGRTEDEDRHNLVHWYQRGAKAERKKRDWKAECAIPNVSCAGIPLFSPGSLVCPPTSHEVLLIFIQFLGLFGWLPQLPQFIMCPPLRLNMFDWIKIYSHSCDNIFVLYHSSITCKSVTR